MARSAKGFLDNKVDMEHMDSSRHLLNPQRERLLELINFRRLITRAEGAYLYTDREETLLDFTSQFGAVPFGHNPEFLWRELQDQARLNPGIMIQPFSSAGARALADRLSHLAPGHPQHITFGCTGAEVVEMAIKMARAKTGRQGILSTLNSFHGKTLGASFATGNAYYRDVFHHTIPDFTYVPFNDVDALQNALSSNRFAAFIVEPVQGEGGMVVPDAGYLKTCEMLCHEHDTLLVVDEVQTGLGRTGTLFACERNGVEPDILLLAKALGGGLLPISACLANDRAWSRDFGERHSSTFANNHLSAAIGLRVLEKLQENQSAVLTQVAEQGNYLSRCLADLVARYPTVFRATSGCGLMQGLALANWRDQDSYLTNIASEEGFAVALVAGYLLNRHGIFTAPTLNASQVLRLQPNYLINRSQIDLLVKALDEVGSQLSAGFYGEFFRAVVGLAPAPRPLQPYRLNLKPLAGPKLGTFAFFIHPTCDADLLACIPGGPDAYDPTELVRIREWLALLKDGNRDASPAYYMPAIPSRQGGYVDGWLISSFLTPIEMLRLSAGEKQALLDSYVAAARQKGASVIGLGAFTSVISRAGKSVRDCGIPVTTGNAYTALSSTDSLRQLCLARGRRLADLCLGVVGAGGSVGRLATLDLAPECRSVILIGRNQTSLPALETLAGELLMDVLRQRKASVLFRILALGNLHEVPLPQGADAAFLRHFYHQARDLFEKALGARHNFPVTLSANAGAALPGCDLVLTATSHGEAFIQPQMLAANALVCDVARPSDLTREVNATRPDLLAYEGGLIHLPVPVRFGGANILGLETGVSLACLAETIVLTMAQVQRHYSLGGVSSLEEARQVFAWAQEHGFSTHLPIAVGPEHSLITPACAAT